MMRSRMLASETSGVCGAAPDSQCFSTTELELERRAIRRECDAAVGLCVGWYQTKAVERGNQNWRNNRLGGGNSKQQQRDDMAKSNSAPDEWIWWVDDEVVSHGGQKFDRRGRSGREKYLLLLLI